MATKAGRGVSTALRSSVLGRGCTLMSTHADCSFVPAARPSRSPADRSCRLSSGPIHPGRTPDRSGPSGAGRGPNKLAGNRPNSWRDGFARDCPLRHPVAWVLALRVCSGLTAVFLVVFRALSAVTGKAPGKREAAEATSRAVSRRSSREPGSLVRVVRWQEPPGIPLP